MVHPEYVAENGVLRLRDGRTCSVRPLVPADREALRAGIERQSTESQYLRFFTTFAHGVPEKIMDGLIAPVDGVDHIALVLLGPDGTAIGVGRLVRNQHVPDSAEISFAVDDDWRGTGAGTALAIALAREARGQGIDYLTASVRVNNDAALAVLASLGVVRSRQVAEPGVYDLEVFLKGADDLVEGADHRDDGRTADSSGADITDAGPTGTQDPDSDEKRPGAVAFAESVAEKVSNALGRQR
ncbi:MAG: N-acetyltransferase family protein [Frankiaceae bacterium]